MKKFTKYSFSLQNNTFNTIKRPIFYFTNKKYKNISLIIIELYL